MKANLSTADRKKDETPGGFLPERFMIDGFSSWTWWASAELWEVMTGSPLVSRWTPSSVNWFLTLLKVDDLLICSQLSEKPEKSFHLGRPPSGRLDSCYHVTPKHWQLGLQLFSTSRRQVLYERSWMQQDNCWNRRVWETSVFTPQQHSDHQEIWSSSDFMSRHEETWDHVTPTYFKCRQVKSV